VSKELATLLILLVLYLPALYLVIREERKLERKYEGHGFRQVTFSCSFCGSPTHLVHDFGNVALAGGFLKTEKFSEERKYRLRLCYCHNCHAVQLADRVEPDAMFRDYFYFSSANETIRRHFRKYADEIVERFHPRKVIEVGCNDGVLMSPLLEHGVNVIGVDPSSTVPKGRRIVNDYFTPEVARKIGKVDMVIANNVFAHIDDIKTATRAVSEALKDDGVFVMEVHYLGDMLEGLQFDWIYHEHIYYYSLMSLEKHLANYGMRVFDVKRVKTHGGSMRYYVCKDVREESPEVLKLRDYEKAAGLDKFETFERFSKRIDEYRDALRTELTGKRVVGYGASGRANAVIQYCGLDMAYMIDDAPAKRGFYTPGSHVPIYGREQLDKDKPERLIVFAWGYLDEIMAKCDLPMLIPFPEIRLIENRKAA